MSGEHVVIDAVAQTLNEIGAPTTDENGCRLSAHGRLTDWLAGRREPRHTGKSEVGLVKHVPLRGSDVEAWIKRYRDKWDRGDNEWNLLDWMLNEYRLHADTGTLLDEQVEGQ
jgi:hypothetical protein